MQKSPTKFSIPDSVLRGESPECTIAAINEKAVGEHVTILAKVTHLNDPTKVRTGKTKRDAIIADSTGSIQFTLWEDQINFLVMGHSYKLINAKVSVFRGAKYLSYPRENASILPAPDVDTGSTQVDDSEDLHL